MYYSYRDPGVSHEAAAVRAAHWKYHMWSDQGSLAQCSVSDSGTKGDTVG